jgi:hypothetical protein
MGFAADSGGKMKNVYPLSACLVASALMFGGCQLVAGLLKAGILLGILGIALVILIIWFLARALS